MTGVAVVLSAAGPGCLQSRDQRTGTTFFPPHSHSVLPKKVIKSPPKQEGPGLPCWFAPARALVKETLAQRTDQSVYLVADCFAPTQNLPPHTWLLAGWLARPARMPTNNTAPFFTRDPYNTFFPPFFCWVVAVARQVPKLA